MRKIPLKARKGSRPAAGEPDDADVVAVALVDDEDYEAVAAHKWRLHTNGSAVTGKATMMHRLILDPDPNRRAVIMHRNGDKLDNRRENLEIVSKARSMKGVPCGRPRKKRMYEVLENGCWRWLLSVNPMSEYGLVWRDGKSRIAHRWMYEQHKGPIPEGLQLHHICHNRWCVNPDHLQPVTRAEHAKLHKAA